jgi:hypothetical protein
MVNVSERAVSVRVLDESDLFRVLPASVTVMQQKRSIRIKRFTENEDNALNY